MFFPQAKEELPTAYALKRLEDPSITDYDATACAAAILQRINCLVTFFEGMPTARILIGRGFSFGGIVRFGEPEKEYWDQAPFEDVDLNVLLATLLMFTVDTHKDHSYFRCVIDGKESLIIVIHINKVSGNYLWVELTRGDG